MKNHVQLIMKMFAAVMFAMFLVVPSFAQILKEGTLPSIKYNIPDTKDMFKVPVDINWEQIALEDEIDQKWGMPMRGGISVPIGKSINEFGEWIALPGGKMLWRVTLDVEGATALGVVFDDFELPEGSELYLYNGDKTMINGALGSHNNNEGRVLSTKVLYGQYITIEYIETPSANNSLRKLGQPGSVNQIPSYDPEKYKTDAALSIGEVMYMYTDVYAVFDASKPNTGGSDFCQIDINCSPVGDNWRNQQRGVIHNLNRIGGSWYFCSSSLVNNTLENFRPYVLSAFHCGEGASVADRNVWQFYFNYERPNCGSGTPPTSDMMTGAVLRAQAPIAGGSDLLLVELNSNVPLSYSPFYNGWNRTNTAATSGASIHHPSGDVKKISTFTATLTSSAPNIGGSVMATNSAWRVVWSSNANGWGVTEGGSSGSPIFNQDGLIVGTLTGGSSFCTNQTAADFYGKVWYHWDQNGTADAQRLQPWLDPAGTNPNTHRGWDPTWTTDPPVANFSATPTTAVSATTIQFTDLSENGPTEWLWNFGANAIPQTSTERNPSVTWTTPGTYNISLTATNSYGSDVETKNNYITITAYTPPTSPVIIGTGTTSGTYWPFGVTTQGTAGSRWVRSASIFTPAEIGGAGNISQIEWRPGTAQTDSRNIKVYLKHTTLNTFAATTVASLISDATLVFDGTFVPNVAGWFPINFQENFGYNGSNNLMVIVLVNTTGAPGNVPSNCHYTTSAGRHQQWTGAAEPTGNGTVNGNRPNVRITIGALTAPTAQFGNEEVYFYEGFENITPDGSLPAGWEQYRTTTLTGTPTTPAVAPMWFLNSSEYGFADWQIYVKNGQGAMATGYTASDFTWAISPAFNIPNTTADVKLWFWMWFSHQSGWSTNFHVRVFADGAWTTLQSYIGAPENQYQTKVELNMNAFKNKNNVRLAFVYQYTDGWQMAIDDILVGFFSTAITQVNVFEGENITFTDASTGTPSLWYWTTPGGTPTSSTDRHPTIRYNVAGQYNVSLKAANAAGENTRTKNNYVNVIGRPPVANWAYASTFWTSAFQPFLQAGDAINYFDESIRVPTSWAWTFNGGNPGSSTAQNPSNVAYNNYGTYNVNMSAVNAHGNDADNRAGFVIVGGQAEITKIKAGDGNLTYYLADDAGTNRFFPGHNQWTVTAYADKYETTHNGTITQVRVLTPIAVGTGKNAIFRVWADNNGVPGAILGSKTVGIPTLSTTEWNTIVFDAPISTTGTFYVGYVITYDATHNYATHQCVVACVPSRGDGTNTAYFMEGTTWYDWSGGIGLNSSLAILPTFEFESLGPVVTPGDVNDDGFINVLDVVWMVSHLNGSTPAGFNMDNADVNGDLSVNIADLTALINLILGGAMGELDEVNSEPAHMYLEEGGNISFESDGTLLALQFELKSTEISEMEIELLLTTDHKLAFNSEKGLGVIYSMTNTIIPQGTIDLLKIDGVDFSQVEWGVALASNVEHRVVDVYTNSAYEQEATNIDQIVATSSDFSVFPNPSTGNFSVKINLQESAYLQIELIDERGRMVSKSDRKYLIEGEHQVQYINQGGQSGLYVIRVTAFDTNGNQLGVVHEEKIMIVK